MTAGEQKFWKIASYVLVIPIICFGPIFSAIAAGYIYGVYAPAGISNMSHCLLHGGSRQQSEGRCTLRYQLDYGLCNTWQH